ncbi:hypothetical protein STRCR_0834 [Streptococcus criceti HS-6]|uniref:Uncharacterized protein n=1 Tax=Streptococcus criceti HS-6 TaxID=873449 RepID=G5JS56_STRCG|nr:hypothetical protein STRCR_0834 [Streptococcus criceti HS-6]
MTISPIVSVIGLSFLIILIKIYALSKAKFYQTFYWLMTQNLTSR